jgi:hypothetical protein
VKIYDEKLKWRANPKIDTHNEQAIERLKSAPKPVVRLFSFNSSSKFYSLQRFMMKNLHGHLLLELIIIMKNISSIKNESKLCDRKENVF